MDRREFEGDAGTPLPDFTSPGINLGTVAPALGISVNRQPDYLEYDQKGRGIIVTMFANTGIAYLTGAFAGVAVGLGEGYMKSPSSRWRVRVNSLLNHSGRLGAKWGNGLGAVAVIYSLYEGIADQLEIDNYVPDVIQPAAPVFAGFMTGATFYGGAGPRGALLAAGMGMGMVGASYVGCNFMGYPYGSFGFLFL